MKIDLTQQDLTYFQSEARNLFVNTPAEVRLPLLNRDLSTADFVTLCHMKAAVAVLVSKGLLPADADIPVLGDFK